MPKLSTWGIRLSLIYLVTGFALGALLMINKAWPFSTGLWTLVPIHGALLLFGWTLQLVIAVAYWILPTFGSRDNRGREWAAWTSVVALNLGVLWSLLWLFWPGFGVVVPAISWLVATISFAWHIWPRIKGFGR